MTEDPDSARDVHPADIPSKEQATDPTVPDGGPAAIRDTEQDSGRNVSPADIPTTEQDTIPDGPRNPVEAVYQAIGHASTCWVGGTGDAVYDSDQAIKVAEDLIAFLRLHPFGPVDIQVLPETASDQRQHTTDRDCWCGPSPVKRGDHETLVVHHPGASHWPHGQWPVTAT